MIAGLAFFGMTICSLVIFCTVYGGLIILFTLMRRAFRALYRMRHASKALSLFATRVPGSACAQK